jgi:hypothetical protein
MVTVTNEMFKCFFFINSKILSPIPSMIHLKMGEGIPSVLLLFVTKCIILHRIQYHVSRFEHQNILFTLVNGLGQNEQSL